MSTSCFETPRQEIEFWMSSRLMGPNYEISDKGRVRSFNYRNKGTTAVISQLIRRRYYAVHNSTKTFAVHRLMADAFMGPRPENYQVNHKDGNKLNNRLENLEFCTASENSLHSYRTGASVIRKGEKSPFSKLDDEKVRAIRALAGIAPHAKIAPQFGVSPAMVGLIIQRKKWAHVT